MNVTDKIWMTTRTGTKAHAFIEGSALCRSSIRQDAGLTRTPVDHCDAQASYNLCTSCVTKFEAAIEITEVQDEVVIKLPAEQTDDMRDVAARIRARGAAPRVESFEWTSTDDTRDVAARIRDRRARLIAYRNGAERLAGTTPPAPDFELDPMTGLPIVTVGDGRYVVGLVQGKAGIKHNPRFVRFWLVDGHRYYEAFEDSPRESIAGLVWAAQAELRNI